MNKYYSFDELIDFINLPNSERCRQIYLDNQEIFNTSPGSPKKHQNWVGGYRDHICEVMNIAIITYEVFQSKRHLDFTLSDALLVSFLHDIEKPWKFSDLKSAIREFNRYGEDKAFLEFKISQYGFELTNIHWNALKYVHGEGIDFNPDTRVQTPLAAFIHLCDTVSARIWFDYPKIKNTW